jgi:protein TonB
LSEPAPPRRRDPPNFDRRYDRPDVREPKAGGGALRALFLIVLLGGAAAAGALYLGGQPATQEAGVETAAPLESGGPVLDTPTPELSAALEQTAPIAAAPTVRAPREDARREEARREEARRQEARREETRQVEPEPPTPAPVTNWNVADNTRGPVSLAPGAAPPAALPAPPPQPAPAPEPAAVQLPPAPAPAGDVRWAQRPNARSISDNYPSRALLDGTGGRVVLSCNVLANLSVACAVASETPANLGFGRAALNVVRGYRAQPTLSNGQPATGARARVTIEFRTTAR